MPALKPRLQITLTGVAVGLQKPLVTDLHRNYWGPKPPQEGLHLSGDQIISAHETFPVSERRSCFLLVSSQGLRIFPASCWFYLQDQGRE